MEHDYQRMLVEEMADTSEYLHSLTEEQWDAPSLCTGWRVRDVVAHQCVGHTMNLAAFPVLLVKYRGNVARGSSVMSVEYGSSHTPEQMLQTYDTVRVDPTHAGLGRVIKVHEVFTDHLIHHQDIRRALHQPRVIPTPRLTGALDALPRIGGFLKSNRLAKGLHFVASDIDWSTGEGPEIRGPAEDLMLAMAGRGLGLETLDGAGVPQLTERIKARQ